jgi:RNA 2',3'-cyclic 3'-phosphodiesterase
MPRFFVALRPPPELRQILLETMGGIANMRWQSDAQLHLTLRFIGDVDARSAEDAASALAAIDYPRPKVALAGVGTFGERHRVHTIWAGIASDPDLKLLRDKIERAVVQSGCPSEARKFKPHITLARCSANAGAVQPFLARRATLASDAFALDAFHLFESHLGGEGASYTNVARYPLR